MSTELYIVITEEVKRNPYETFKKIKHLVGTEGSYSKFLDRVTLGASMYGVGTSCVWFETWMTYGSLEHAIESSDAYKYKEYKLIKKNLIGGKLL